MRPWGWLVLGLWGCASIQAPDGGPPDTEPPRLRKLRVRPSPQGVRLVFFWDEYLSPSSQLGATGLWVNPAHPFRARLRGKRLLLRVDSVSGGVSVWGGPGLKDFTEGNSLLPQPLWWRYPPQDTSRVQVRLEPPPDAKAAVWAEFHTDSGVYRFLAWQGQIEILGLPAGAYKAWAWADADGNQRWDVAEPVWLPNPFELPTQAESDTSAEGRVWQKGQLDTLRPAMPRLALRDSLWGVLVSKEPLTFQVLSGSGRALCEEAFLLQRGSTFALYDSAGNAYIDTFSLERDTQAYQARLFWPIAANLVLPQLYLTTPILQATQETLWIGQVRDTVYAAGLYREAEELYLDPFSAEGEAQLRLEVGRETMEVRLPARKYAVHLPVDSVGEVRRWRIYGTWPLGAKGAAWALPGQVVWLPGGTYHLIGLAEEGPFWQPVQLEAGLPVYRQPILRLQRLVVPPSSPSPP